MTTFQPGTQHLPTHCTDCTLRPSIHPPQESCGQWCALGCRNSHQSTASTALCAYAPTTTELRSMVRPMSLQHPFIHCTNCTLRPPTCHHPPQRSCSQWCAPHHCNTHPFKAQIALCAHSLANHPPQQSCGQWCALGRGSAQKGPQCRPGAARYRCAWSCV